MKRKLLLVSALLALFITACQEKDQQTPSSQNTVDTGEYETSIKDLSKRINLPYKPLKVKWEIEKFGENHAEDRFPVDFNEYALNAILEFDKKDADKIKKEAGEPSIGEGIGWKKERFKEWYPPEIKDHFGKDKWFPKLYTLKSPYYSPDPFIKDPLRQGFFFFIDEDTIYLNLNAM